MINGDGHVELNQVGVWKADDGSVVIENHQGATQIVITPEQWINMKRFVDEYDATHGKIQT